MAIVYAEMNELNNFQESLETTASPLERESTSQEDLIKSTQRMLEGSLHIAEEREHTAESELYEAQKALSEAEARTAEYNSHLEENQDPMTTSDFYYEQVDDCSQNMEYATLKRQGLETAMGSFADYCRRYHESQAKLISQYKELLKESGDFFEEYIDILIKAKEAILKDSESAGEGQAAYSLSVGVSELEEEDVEKIATATGWDKGTIKQKCGKDGPIYTYRTLNAEMENKLHPSGVFYERSKFEIDGVCFEGVFPKFNAVCEPNVMPNNLWNLSGSKYTTQFSYCNEYLRSRVSSDSTLASQFNAIQLSQIAAGKTPSGYTWHHHQEPGRMQLVRKKEHNVAIGGAGHTGGGALWCK